MVEKELIKNLYCDKKYTVEEIADYLQSSYWPVYNLMKKYNIVRRGRSEAGFNSYKNKPCFKLNPNLSAVDEKLKISGIMLYWAEGTLKGNTVDFANSNPEMIGVFLKFLRNVCGISEKRLRLYLYIYNYQDQERIKKYWSEVTNIPRSQFTKPYIRKGNLNLSKRKLPFGLVHIRYNDKKLLKVISRWIEEYRNSVLCWAGTQVAKGGRLSKAAFC